MIQARSQNIRRELDDHANQLGPDMVKYLNYRRDRYVWEAQLIDRLMVGLDQTRSLRLLDIGPSFQTLMFHALFRERMVIDTFGFADAKFPPPAGGKHLDFDLNDAYFPERWLKVPPYDLITMFAVIEHLYTSPVQVLQMLRSMTAKGGLIIITTPNAVTLMSRIRMLLGKNPFERIREDRNNPGHYREYTRREMCEMGIAAGLRVREFHILNLSFSSSLKSRLFNSLGGLFPQELRKELIVVFENP